MNLTELRTLLDQPAGIEQAELELLSALGQRLVRLPRTADLNTLTDCTCGLLLVQLPRTITVQRAYVTFARTLRPSPASYGPRCAECRAEIRLHEPKRPCTVVTTKEIELTHAHAAHTTTGAPACKGCFDNPAACTHNPDSDVCDTPEPVGCLLCADPVLPGDLMCARCTPGLEGRTRHLDC